MSTKQTDNQAIRRFLVDRVKDSSDVTSCLSGYFCGHGSLSGETSDEYVAYRKEAFHAFILRMQHLLTRCQEASEVQLAAWLTLMPKSAPPEAVAPERLQALRMDLAAMLGLRVVAGR